MKIVVKKGFWLSNDFLIFMTLVTSMSFRDIPFISVYGKLLFPIVLLYKYIKSHKVSLPVYKVKIYGYYFAFFVLCMCSVLWAIRPDYVLSKCFVLLRLYFTVFAIGCTVNCYEDVDRCLKLLHYAGIVLFARLLLNTPLDIWKAAIMGDYDISSSQGRIGATVGYHPNELGAICLLLLLLSLYFQSKSKKTRKYWLVWDAIICLVLLFTKSRLSLLLAIAGVALYIIISQQIAYKRIMLIIVGVLFLLVAWYSIFNIPILYELVGFRFAAFMGNSSVQDASSLTRLKFLSYAVQLFSTSPLVGIGIDNFKYYVYSFQNAWAEVHSHSNWGELLADTGVIGILLYYMPYFATIVILVKKLKGCYGDSRKRLALFMVFMIITVIGDIQKLSYDTFEVFFPSMLAFFTRGYLITENTKRRNVNIET